MVQCYPFLSGFLAAHELGEGHSFKEIKCGGNIKNLLLRKEKQTSEFLCVHNCKGISSFLSKFSSQDATSS